MWSVQEFTRKTRYIVTAILTLGTILFTLYVYSKSKGEYYIPKPKALLKINLPDNNSALYSDKKLSFRYSKSAHVSTKKNTYSVNFLDYHSRIYFTINDLTDLDLEIYNFENSISVHEKKGAYINVNIVEDTSALVYGVLCYLEGNNIATSSQFFITDSIRYFVRGGLEFNSAIIPEIEVQNVIMKQEVFKFIQSLKWQDK